ncbi:MAG: ADP-ribosylglycohydrolase family protein [Candidatus Promineifilaceae bacterium]
MSKLPADYNERVYAGWLGKCIGVRFGAPLEGWSYQEIAGTLGEVTGYLPLPPGKLFKPDDDTALPMILIQALEDYGPQVTAAQFGETWLNYLADRRGTLWWGGYGVSTEQTAYENLASGVAAPLSGSTALNGAAVAEQIGGQIFSDIWGLVAPNDPRLAASYAARASSVSHDGDGIAGGMFIAGLVSAAFSESKPRKLVQAGLSLIPPNSEYARVVTAVLDFHGANPADWRAAYHFLFENFGYDRYPGEVHIIPNAGVVVMALLYGNGDFSRTIQIANMAGWDTDCNVGNAGAIMGVAVGLAGIGGEWRGPLDDLLVTAGLLGSRNLWTIPACADLFARSGRAVAASEGGADGQADKLARRHFRYPGSTQNMQFRGDKGRVIALQHAPDSCLLATVRKLSKKGEVRLFARAYVRPAELSANYYGASFSPLIYPGQTVRARLMLPQTPGSEAPDLRAALYVHDGNTGSDYQALAESLMPGAGHELVFEIPAKHNALLSEVGIVLRNMGAQPWTGNLCLEWLDWDGAPHFSNDFALERPEYGAISQFTFLRGYWRQEDGRYHGSGAGVNESYSGDVTWRDYYLRVRMRPLLGDHHLALARVQGARRSYAAGLGPEGRLVLYKNQGGYQSVAAAPFAWQAGEEYEITISANGPLIRTSAAPAGQRAAGHLDWVDESEPYLNGQIGLANFAGCHTEFSGFSVGPVGNEA